MVSPFNVVVEVADLASQASAALLPVFPAARAASLSYSFDRAAANRLKYWESIASAVTCGKPTQYLRSEISLPKQYPTLLNLLQTLDISE